MEYYVIGPNGGKYGPASIDVLNGWIAEGRIVPHTMLVTEAGLNLMAMDVQGLVFPNAAPPAMNYGQFPPANVGASYYRPASIDSKQVGSEVIVAWVLGGLTLLTGWLCCLVAVGLGAGGVVMAVQARNKNQTGALAAVIFNAFALVIAILGPFLLQMILFRNFGGPSFF